MIHIETHLRQFGAAARLGAGLRDRWALLRLLYSRAARRRDCPQPVLNVRLRCGRSNIPWQLRDNGSDVGTLVAALVTREYEIPLLEPATVRRVLDLGGNIGSSALYFSSVYPNAEVVVLEPEPGNFALLTHNWHTAKLHGRLLRNAVAATSGVAHLRVTDWAGGHVLDDGTELLKERSVLGVLPVQCLTVGQVMEMMAWTSIDVVKMDIEGSEWPLVREGAGWLRKVRAVVGEVHDWAPLDRFRQVFLDAGFSFERRPDRPLFVATNLRRPS